MINLIGLFLLTIRSALSASADNDTESGFVADVVLVIDNSIRSDKQKFEVVRKTMIELPKHINITEDQVHIGVIHFGSEAIVDVPLTANKTSYIERVKSWKKVKFHPSTTSLGLQHAQQILQASVRPTVRKYAVLLTDGKQTSTDQAEKAAKNLRGSNIELYVLYVGQSDYDILPHMLTMAGDPSHLFAISDNGKFNATFVQLFRAIMHRQLCSECRSESCPSDCVSSSQPSVTTATSDRADQSGTTHDDQLTADAMRWRIIGGALAGVILVTMIIVVFLTSSSKKTPENEDEPLKNDRLEKPIIVRKLLTESSKRKDAEKVAIGGEPEHIDANLQISLNLLPHEMSKPKFSTNRRTETGTSCKPARKHKQKSPIKTNRTDV